MPLQKKEKSPVSLVIRMVYDALAIAYSYQRDLSYIPTMEELKLLDELEHALFECHASTSHINDFLQQRTT